MLASLQDILDTVKSNTLTYQQKLMCLGNIAERLFDPRELLGYTDEEWQFLQNQMICDLNEGYAIYRPRYILPDYNVYIKKGCEFLELPPPKDLDEVLDGLLILYSHVPSITTFPVYIGRLDMLLDPFITDEKQDYIKIKRFLNHVDKTVPDSFCHANIGPYDTKAGRLILKAVIELEAPTPNMTIRYDKSKTSREFAELAAKACLLVSKPSFANDAYYISDLGEQYGIASCYNALPECGGAYTLTRLRLGTIARACKTVDEMADIYNFTADQREMLAELLAEESNGMWSAVLYGIGTGDGEIVTVALSQLGNVGGQPYWSWYGFESRVDWCACFISWCANECGYLDAGVIPRFASCSIGIQWFRERGLWQDSSYEPRPGDLIFFDWDDEDEGQDGAADHVGIVEKVEGGIVYTVEGNSGNACRERQYAIGHYEIYGYGTPLY